jgi:hypothetical protein
MTDVCTEYVTVCVLSALTLLNSPALHMAGPLPNSVARLKSSYHRGNSDVAASRPIDGVKQ